MLWEVLSWIVFGLVIGFVARALYPGPQKLSLPNTVALGIAGSVVGGMITHLLTTRDASAGLFSGAGWIMSIVGALIVVGGAMAFSRRT